MIAAVDEIGDLSIQTTALFIDRLCHVHTASECTTGLSVQNISAQLFHFREDTGIAKVVHMGIQTGALVRSQLLPKRSH